MNHRLYGAPKIMTTSRLRKRLMLALLAAASLTAIPAQAYGPRGHGHYPGPSYRSHGYYGPSPWWWVAGTGLLLYPQIVAPRPQVIVQSPPVEPVIVQPQPTAQNWYYCDSAQAYYPYVQSCAEGWRAVPATPAVTAQQAPASGNWYYCDSAQAYYPYVKECPGGWRATPATPPAPGGPQ
ncbi:hypothetical protein [Zoogloea sp.]|uniref:hypothetical protein n=1 Tax=Zoogloea sp. TaxID=49181 RepID=UPI0031FDD0C4